LKPGVSVLALDEQQNVYLTEEFHYGVGRVTLEVVSGGCEATEDPLCTAQRELQEELGITAAQWDDLGVCDPFTANVVSPTRLYLARRLQFGSTAPEGTERIRCVKMPFDEAVASVMESRITHAPSCLVILKAAYVLNGRA
jgi:ADP-ribose pyrophosphatase